MFLLFLDTFVCLFFVDLHYLKYHITFTCPVVRMFVICITQVIVQILNIIWYIMQQFFILFYLSKVYTFYIFRKVCIMYMIKRCDS